GLRSCRLGPHPGPLPPAGEGAEPGKRDLKALSLKPCVMRPSPVTTTGRLMSCGYSFSSSFHSASEPGVLRFGARLRQVVEDLLTMASHPPSASRQASRVSGDWRWSR